VEPDLGIIGNSNRCCTYMLKYHYIVDHCLDLVSEAFCIGTTYCTYLGSALCHLPDWRLCTYRSSEIKTNRKPCELNMDSV